MLDNELELVDLKVQQNQFFQEMEMEKELEVLSGANASDRKIT